MAIAFDTAVDGGATFSGTSLTWSHTCTGSDPALVVGVLSDTTSDLITGVTYNTVDMTLVDKVKIPNSGRWNYHFLLLNPATGAHNVVASASVATVIIGVSASYTGAAQSAQPDSHNTGTASASSSITVATTVVANDCWLIAECGNSINVQAGGTGTTERVESVNAGFGMYDSNGTVPTGSQALQVVGSAGDYAMAIMSLAPATSGITYLLT